VRLWRGAARRGAPGGRRASGTRAQGLCEPRGRATGRGGSGDAARVRARARRGGVGVHAAAARAARRAAAPLVLRTLARARAALGLSHVLATRALTRAAPRLRTPGIIATTDVEEACRGVNVAGAWLALRTHTHAHARALHALPPPLQSLRSARPLTPRRVRPSRARSYGGRLPAQGGHGAQGGTHTRPHTTHAHCAPHDECPGVR
jgi:hypothetical protein